MNIHKGINMTEMYDDIDQTQGERIRAAAPDFFVTEMKKYVSRNSIRTNPAEFALYCACTWEEQSGWLNKDNIGWAIRCIVSSLPFPRLPADTDWEKPRSEYWAEQYKKKQELEWRKKQALPRPKPTPEQIKKVEIAVANATKKLTEVK